MLAARLLALMLLLALTEAAAELVAAVAELVEFELDPFVHFESLAEPVVRLVVLVELVGSPFHYLLKIV